MPADPEFAEVFISHSSNDAAAALRVAEFVCTYLTVPSDEVICTSAQPFSLATGAHYERDIRMAISKCSVFVFLASASSMNSLFCVMELGAAWGRAKKILPIAMPGLKSQGIDRPLSSLHVAQWQSLETWTQLLEQVESKTGAARKKAKLWNEAALALAQSVA